MRLAAAPAAAAIIGPQTEVLPGLRIELRDGHLDLMIPAGEKPLDLAVAIAAADASTLATHVATTPPPPPPRSLVSRGAPPLWATPITTHIAAGRDRGPFAVDVLAAPEANPWNAQVRFSGIDFTGPDTAVICSWDGDVWSVSGIAVAEGGLTWRRTASGLFQPLGVKVIDGVIHSAVGIGS